MKIPVVILTRVSTVQQENDRQISELTNEANIRGWNVIEHIREQISGALEETDRPGLQRAKELAQSGAIKKILVHEVSRLARKNSVAHKFLEEMEALGVSIYWHAQGIETLLSNGKRNPAASIMFSLLAEMARSERETLSERVKSGLEEAKRKGKRLGRPEGSVIPVSALLAKHRDIVRLLKAGQSVRNTAKIVGKNPSTVQKVKSVLVATRIADNFGVVELR